MAGSTLGASRLPPDGDTALALNLGYLPLDTEKMATLAEASMSPVHGYSGPDGLQISTRSFGPTEGDPNVWCLFTHYLELAGATWDAPTTWAVRFEGAGSVCVRDERVATYRSYASARAAIAATLAREAADDEASGAAVRDSESCASHPIAK